MSSEIPAEWRQEAEEIVNLAFKYKLQGMWTGAAFDRAAYEITSRLYSSSATRMYARLPYGISGASRYVRVEEIPSKKLDDQ